MTLWFVFALMTVAAIFAVLWPLSRGGRPQREGSEAAVYKDQLSEIDRDVTAGLIGSSEAEAARIEISRRLLAARDSQDGPLIASSTRLRPIRGHSGPGWAPDRGGGDLPCRWDRPGSAIFRWPSAPAHPMSRNRSRIWWRRSRPIWRRIRPMAGAGTCWRRSWRGSAATMKQSAPIAIRSPTTATVPSAGPTSAKRWPPRRVAWSPAEAKAEFERAVALNADEVKASYFLGLAAEQDGRAGDAASIWRAMLAKAPPDAPWRPLVQAALARVGR